jgi:hypothetical protein
MIELGHGELDEVSGEEELIRPAEGNDNASLEREPEKVRGIEEGSVAKSDENKLDDDTSPGSVVVEDRDIAVIETPNAVLIDLSYDKSNEQVLRNPFIEDSDDIFHSFDFSTGMNDFRSDDEQNGSPSSNNERDFPTSEDGFTDCEDLSIEISDEFSMEFQMKKDDFPLKNSFSNPIVVESDLSLPNESAGKELVFVSDGAEFKVQNVENDMVNRIKILATEETSYSVIADEDDALLRAVDNANSIVENIVNRSNLQTAFRSNDPERSVDEFSRRRKIFASDESVSFSVVSKEHEEILQAVDRTNAIVERIVQRRLDESDISRDSASCTSSITHFSITAIPEKEPKQLIADTSDITHETIEQKPTSLPITSISDNELSPKSGAIISKESDSYFKISRNSVEDEYVENLIEDVLLKDDTCEKMPFSSPVKKPRYQKLYEESMLKRKPKNDQCRSKRKDKTFKKPDVFDRLYNLSMPMQINGKARREKMNRFKKYKPLQESRPRKINPGPGPRLYRQGMLSMLRLEKRRAENFGPDYKSPIWPPKGSTESLEYLLN